MMEDLVPEVGAFLLGAPKSGTTWLASALEQHPEICISEPKEPNEIATHKGTFGRDVREPDWERYAGCFHGDGVKMDCSVHALACPVAPSRVAEHWPDARFVVCLREPISRTISHWEMVLDTDEDKQNDVDWSEFTTAWRDHRLSCDTLYGACMGRWLECFPRDRFLVLDSRRMRSEADVVLAEVVGHLGLEVFNFNLNEVHNTNTAADRRPLTVFGRGLRFAAALIPDLLKRPLVSLLQSRGVNVYKMPILSRSKPARPAPSAEQCREMRNQVKGDLGELMQLTGFPIDHWLVGNQ